MREKSGVGFVNAINSVNNALDLDTLTVEAVPHTPTETARFYCNAGQKIRAVMTFDKRNDVLISSDSDIDDVDLTIWNESNFSINASSMSIVNNVEIIEYTVPVSGYYYFDLVPWVLEDDNPPYMSLAYRLY